MYLICRIEIYTKLLFLVRRRVFNCIKCIALDSINFLSERLHELHNKCITGVTANAVT